MHTVGMSTIQLKPLEYVRVEVHYSLLTISWKFVGCKDIEKESYDHEVQDNASDVEICDAVKTLLGLEDDEMKFVEIQRVKVTYRGAP